MQVLIIEPFFTGSHRRWCLEYQDRSKHDVQILSMPGRHWKWRMEGGAVALAEKFNQLESLPDVILFSDMIDIPRFLGLLTRDVSAIKKVLYFHENQLVYPWSVDDKDVKLQRDMHYCFINYISCLPVDQILFNSEFHRASFLSALKTFVHRFPDGLNLESLSGIESKSQVLHLGLDLKVDEKKHPNSVPVVLWNHRWEFDKNPEAFFNVLSRIKSDGLDFKLAVVGESFKKVPQCFQEAKMEFDSELIHFGYAETREEYEELLLNSDIIPVTSKQDFFGGSVVEAIASGVMPILPNRLAFPEHVPSGKHIVYENDEELYEQLKSIILSWPDSYRNLSRDVKRYDWSNMAPVYDQVMGD